MKIAVNVLAAVGFVSLLFLTVGLYLDVSSFDRTEGGYEPPYEGATGEPVDWNSMDLTATGLVKRGHIANVIVNGTTGMISIELFKTAFDFRVFSDRALKVHKPREAFIELGFKPEF